VGRGFESLQGCLISFIVSLAYGGTAHGGVAFFISKRSRAWHFQWDKLPTCPTSQLSLHQRIDKPDKETYNQGRGEEMTPEQFERLLNFLDSLARSLQGDPWRNVPYILIGAVLAALGGVIGGWVQGWVWFRYEQKRAAAEKRVSWREAALDWAARGRKDSLRWADLSGADLTGVDLGPGEGVDHGADLSFADLSRAYFFSADLRGVDMIRAKLQEAILVAANLQGAALWHVDLRGGDLRSANLQQADLRYANLQGALLDIANLREAHLPNANLRGAVLWRADLQGADLSHTNLQRAILHDADLYGANLHGADLTGVEYNITTRWPEGFTPPGEAVFVDVG
jgi:uncharacterized protein YjbI with pentapeptide repeats